MTHLTRQNLTKLHERLAAQMNQLLWSPMVSNRGKVTTTEVDELPGGSITDVQAANTLANTGKWQCCKDCKEVSHNLLPSTENLEGATQILKSHLGKNKVQAINKYVLQMIKYTTKRMAWPKDKIDATDVKTRGSA